MRRLASTALIVCAVLAAGCIDLEQNLTLERNLSGKAGFSMKFDLEPMVLFMAKMSREMEGRPGEPTAAEIEAVKKELLSSGQTTGKAEFEEGRKDLQGKLPDGVTLLDARFQQDALKMAADFAFGFDHVGKLSQIAFPKKDEGGGPVSNPVDNPFDNLKVVDEGATILVTGPVENPMSDRAAQAPPDPETRKQIEAMFKGLRVAFKITAPFAVVESTAMRRDGNTLIWEYDLASLEKMTPEQMAQGIRVRYRK